MKRQTVTLAFLLAAITSLAVNVSYRHGATRSIADSVLCRIIDSELQQHVNVPEYDVSSLCPTASPDVWVLKRAWYELEQLRDDVYFMTTGCESGVVPVSTERYPIETLHNMMLQVISAGHRSAMVTTHVYGLRSVTQSVSLAGLLAALTDGGETRVYCAVTDANEHSLSALVFFFDTGYNVLHMCEVVTSPSDLFNDEGEFTVSLHPNIPQNNVSNLWATE